MNEIAQANAMAQTAVGWRQIDVLCGVAVFVAVPLFERALRHAISTIRCMISAARRSVA